MPVNEPLRRIEEESRKYRCLCGSSDTFTACNKCGERWFMPGQLHAAFKERRAPSPVVAEVVKRLRAEAKALDCSEPASLRVDGARVFMLAMADMLERGE